MQLMGIQGPLTFDESIQLGVTKVRDISVTGLEWDKLIRAKNRISSTIKSEFEDKFSLWRKTWDDPKIKIYSDPQRYAQSVEYYDFKLFCIKHGKGVWPLIIEKFVEGNFYCINIIKDLLYQGNESLLNTVKLFISNTQYEPDGTFIFTTTRDRWLLFCKEILAREY